MDFYILLAVWIKGSKDTSLTVSQFKGEALAKLLVSAFIIISTSARAVWADSLTCSASTDYLSELKRFAVSLRVEQDYSCLTNYPSIAPKIKTYQLVDIRKSPDFQIEQAWIIPTDELKHKAFLINRPLLLLSDGFSRVSLASDCALLKKAGFTNVKMLIGGAPLWRLASVNAKHPTTPQFVSARNLITEYFNGRVSIISASEKISEKLKKIGITKIATLAGDQFSLVSDLVVSTSNGGFDPVVYIGDPQSRLNVNNQQTLPNLYQLQGEIDALVAQLNNDVLVEASREAPQGIPFCAK
jgi:rhodanese-related sulfurtransferase